MSCFTLNVSLIIELLSSVPHAVWAAAIAAGFTLFGVSVQNRSHRKNLKIQLESDAIENSRERIITARRPVYLAYADESARAFGYLGGMSQFDIGKVNVYSGVQGFTSAISQAAMVCESSTASMLTKMNALFASLLLDLFGKMMPISTHMNTVDILTTGIDAAHSEGKRAWTEMQKMYEEGASFQEKFSQLKETHRLAVQRMEELNDERSVVYENLKEERKIFNQFFFENVTPLSQLNVEIMIALRAELGIATDSSIAMEIDTERDNLLKKAGAAIASL